MNAVFLNVVNMSITASWLILAILFIQVFCRLFFKNMPKYIYCVLWGLAGIRLIIPYSFESIFSLIPDTKSITQALIPAANSSVHDGMQIAVNTSNPVIWKSSASYSTNPEAAATSFSFSLSTFTDLWLAGVIILLLYFIISSYRLHKKTAESILLQEYTQNNIMICDHIDTPFVLGIVKPLIYIPSHMDSSLMPYVIAHENAHLKRLDHIWKPLGFVLLSIYWFNPLTWIAYIMFCRDIELACDEKVIKEMETEDKKSYSRALISCTTAQKTGIACPLAFAEVNVKQRIQSILSYKKPAIGVLMAASAICIITVICFLTNPITRHENNDTANELPDGFTYKNAASIFGTDSIEYIGSAHLEDELFLCFSYDGYPGLLTFRQDGEKNYILETIYKKDNFRPSAANGENSIWTHLYMKTDTWYVFVYNLNPSLNSIEFKDNLDKNDIYLLKDNLVDDDSKTDSIGLTICEIPIPDSLAENLNDYEFTYTYYDLQGNEISHSNYHLMGGSPVFD